MQRSGMFSGPIDSLRANITSEILSSRPSVKRLALSMVPFLIFANFVFVVSSPHERTSPRTMMVVIFINVCIVVK
jgi:hypothetical protein